jgi:colicin import membrane protein
MVVGSALAHLALLGVVLFSPGSSDEAPARVISVDLVAAPSAAPARAAAKPAPAPKPEPVPAAAPPPPPKPKAIVLPEKSQAKPEAKPKPKPKPREPEVFKEPPKKQEKSLEELLAEMRDKAGESAPSATPAAAEPVETASAPNASPGSLGGQGEQLSAEERDWHGRVIRKMKGIWVVPPGFRTQTLQTRVVVTLDAQGNIVGAPRITQRSGNPWYDDGVVRGLTKANPLPPPPEPGDWSLWFEPGDSL